MHWRAVACVAIAGSGAILSVGPGFAGPISAGLNPSVASIVDTIPPSPPADTTQTVTTTRGLGAEIFNEIGPAPVSQLSDNGAWCWFGDPRAVRVGDATYVSWITAQGDVQLAQYDHATHGLVTSTLHTGLQIDDHACPSILVLPDHRFMVFYSPHAASPMYYRVSKNPEDITMWQSERTVPRDYRFTYPNPFQLHGEGDIIYLFWRGGDFRPAFATTSDGNSWSVARVLVDGPLPYVKYASDGDRRIHFAFTESHPELSATNSIYYAYYEDGHIYRADGTLIRSVAQLPIEPLEADRIYDAVTGGARAWVWDLALDHDGRPVIVYATLPSSDDHRYRYARWTGSAWDDHEISSAGGSIETSGADPYYSGGIVLDHDDPDVVYLTRQRSPGNVHELDRWITTDGGATWSVEELTQGSLQKNMRPVVPRGRSPLDMGVVWMRGTYTSYTQYRTTLLFTTGPVDRVAIDVRPGSCPNGRLADAGRLPVAIVGSPRPNLQDIDHSSVRLAGNIEPLRSAMEDVSGPQVQGDACDCAGMAPDGIPDLVLHFDSGRVAAALDPFATGPQPLRVTGRLRDGTPFEGEDCVILNQNGQRSPRTATPSVVSSALDRSRAILYELPEATQVRLAVFDVRGRLVQTLLDARQPTGPHRLEWDTTHLPTGVYLLRFEAVGRVETHKVVVSR